MILISSVILEIVGEGQKWPPPLAVRVTKISVAVRVLIYCFRNNDAITKKLVENLMFSNAANMTKSTPRCNHEIDHITTPVSLVELQ